MWACKTGVEYSAHAGKDRRAVESRCARGCVPGLENLGPKGELLHKGRILF